MSEPLAQLDVFCVEMISQDDALHPGCRYGLVLRSAKGGPPIGLAVTKEAYEAARDPHLRGQPLMLTLALKENGG
jgi:hypothetical protein